MKWLKIWKSGISNNLFPQILLAHQFKTISYLFMLFQMLVSVYVKHYGYLVGLKGAVQTCILLLLVKLGVLVLILPSPVYQGGLKFKPQSGYCSAELILKTPS